MTLNIYCDGGARGNPGPAASAFIVKDPGGKVLHQQGFYLGIATNNQAEYQAVIEAMKWLSSFQSPPTAQDAKRSFELGGDLRGGIEVNFYLDSELVVRQLTGIYRVKDQNLKIKKLEIDKLITREARGTRNYKLKIKNFVHIPRSQNSAADLLVNKTLDSHS